MTTKTKRTTAYTQAGWYSFKTTIKPSEETKFKKWAEGWRDFYSRKYPGFEIDEWEVVGEPIWDTHEIEIECKVHIRRRKNDSQP